MKQYYIFLIALVIALFSCKDNDDSGCSGAPVITSVKHYYTEGKNIVMEEIENGNMGTWIVIEGDNFCDVESITFNDVEVSFSQIYIESKKISLAIPRELPKDLTNVITVTNRRGSATRSFEVNIPPLVINGLVNEFVKNKEIAYIDGDNFDLYRMDSVDGAWLKMGDSIIPIYRESSKRIKFKMPIAMKQNAEMFLYRKDSLGNMRVDVQVPGLYKDKRFMMFDFQNISWLPQLECTDGLGKPSYPDSIAGKYGVLKGTAPDYNRNYALYFDNQAPLADFIGWGDVDRFIGPVGDKAIVFEVFVVNDWVRTPLNIEWCHTHYQYKWAPYGGQAFKTFAWETVRIPLKDFIDTRSTTEEQTTYIQELTGDDLKTWGKYRRFYIQGPQGSDVFICIDNVRIVPEYKRVEYYEN